MNAGDRHYQVWITWTAKHVPFTKKEHRRVWVDNQPDEASAIEVARKYCSSQIQEVEVIRIDATSVPFNFVYPKESA